MIFVTDIFDTTPDFQFIQVAGAGRSAAGDPQARAGADSDFAASSTALEAPTAHSAPRAFDAPTAHSAPPAFEAHSAPPALEAPTAHSAPRPFEAPTAHSAAPGHRGHGPQG